MRAQVDAGHHRVVIGGRFGLLPAAFRRVLRAHCAPDALLEIAQQAGVLDFSNPVDFRELYDPKNRLDEGHTNRGGSEIYTRMIVEKVLQHL